MSTRDEIAHAVDLFGSAMHDLAITHYKGEVTEKDLAVYTRRRLELINLLAPPAPGEVRLTLSRKQAEAMRIELAEARSYFGEMLGDAQDGLSALESALTAAAAPEER